MKYTLFALTLCFFATGKVLADVLGLESLSAVAAVTNVAPAMKVFTAQKGYETYSSVFELTVNHTDGRVHLLRDAEEGAVAQKFRQQDVVDEDGADDECEEISFHKSSPPTFHSC